MINKAKQEQKTINRKVLTSFVIEGILEMKKVKILAISLLLILVVSISALADSAQVEQLLYVAVEQLETPYELFSSAPDSFNCMTFIIYCFNQVASDTITINGIEGGYQKITSMRNVIPGNIVCFKGSNKLKGILGYHFGIYIGKGYFIHASNSVGKVTASKLEKYRKRFIGAVRLF